MDPQRSRLSRFAGAALVAGGVLLFASAAAAHPDIDEAHRLYDDAAFTEALDALVRAEQSERLTEPELRELLALRATIHFATRADDAFHSALRTLASIAPDHRFDPNLPPLFLEAWQQARDAAEPLEVHVAMIERGDTLRFHAYVEGSAESLVPRAPALYVRARGGEWRPGRNGVLVLHGVSENAVELYAEATGPGGVIVARHGDADAPRVASVVPLVHATPSEPPPSDPVPWLVAGVASMVAVALAVALVVVATADETPDRTLVHGPSF
jgi:hypothetical protein